MQTLLVKVYSLLNHIWAYYCIYEFLLLTHKKKKILTHSMLFLVDLKYFDIHALIIKIYHVQIDFSSNNTYS